MHAACALTNVIACMCTPFTVQTLMDLSQIHTLQKIVFHMTKQEIEEEIGRG